MGRLIDEDILIKRIYEYQTNAIDTEDVIHSIKTMPTAYDVEAVVAELKKIRDDENCDNVKTEDCLSCRDCQLCLMNRAIGIVRGKE
jgi:hypothetical protein